MTKKETDLIIDIRDYCFRHAYEGETLEDFRNWIEISTTIGAFNKERLVGQLMILPLQINLHGQIYDMGGIGFVATYPEYRNSGVMKQLIIHSLKEMKNRGQTISILGPFSVAFYRYFGWEVFFDRLNYNLPIEKIHVDKKNLNGIIRFDYSYMDNNILMVKEVYEKYALKTNGMMQRDEKWWKRLKMRQPKAMFAVVLNEEGEAEGYIRYLIQDMDFILLDFIALNIDAEQKLWQYIYVHQSNVSTVRGSAAAHESFGSTWENPQFEKKVIQDKMVRIVDVEKFLSAYPFNALEKTLYLKVTDHFAPWNQGVYKIENQKTTKIAEKEQDACLQMDITSLSSFLVGYHDINWYHYQNKAVATKEVLAGWAKAVPAEKPQFYGHF